MCQCLPRNVLKSVTQPLLLFQAAALPKGAKVEIEAIAVVGEIQDE